MVRSATKVNAEVLKHAGQMRIVGRAGVGVDNIDVAAATKQGLYPYTRVFGALDTRFRF